MLSNTTLQNYSLGELSFTGLGAISSTKDSKNVSFGTQDTFSLSESFWTGMHYAVVSFTVTLMVACCMFLTAYMVCSTSARQSCCMWVGQLWGFLIRQRGQPQRTVAHSRDVENIIVNVHACATDVLDVAVSTVGNDGGSQQNVGANQQVSGVHNCFMNVERGAASGDYITPRMDIVEYI